MTFYKKFYAYLVGIIGSVLCLAASTIAFADAATTTATTANGRILFVVSSHKFHGNSAIPASISFGEVVHAFDIFRQAGYAVDFVSPAGGAVPIDAAALGPRLTARLQDQSLMAGLMHTKTPAQIDASHYRAMYYVGGSNAMYQVPDELGLQSIARQIYEQQGGVLSAVCHGTAGLVRVKLSSGEYLIKGKKVTGYPEEYEEHNEPYVQHLPFAMRKTIEAHGGLFKAPDPEQAYIEVDGRLVTGQNYPSAPLVARAVLDILQHQASAKR